VLCATDSSLLTASRLQEDVNQVAVATNGWRLLCLRRADRDLHVTDGE
jgi:hypothetical protein